MMDGEKNREREREKKPEREGWQRTPGMCRAAMIGKCNPTQESVYLKSFQRDGTNIFLKDTFPENIVSNTQPLDGSCCEFETSGFSAAGMIFVSHWCPLVHILHVLRIISNAVYRKKYELIMNVQCLASAKTYKNNFFYM